jgi:hypothetical protein
MKSRKRKAMSKAGSYVCGRYKCKGNLITVYTASGIKLAGRQYRVLYGTREVDTALLIVKLGTEPVEVRSSHTWIV